MARDPQTPPEHPDEILTLTDMAKLLKLGSRKTAQRAYDDGELPVANFYLRGQPRWRWADVQRWIRGLHSVPVKTGQNRTHPPDSRPKPDKPGHAEK